MATIQPVSMAATAASITLQIKVTHVRRTRMRLWLFAKLLALAAFVCPAKVEIERSGP